MCSRQAGTCLADEELRFTQRAPQAFDDTNQEKKSRRTEQSEAWRIGS